LAPEKNGLLFAKIVVELASFLTEMEIEPVLCAPPKTSNEAYRREVIRLFESAHVPKSTVLDHFLGPTELAALQRRSLLNFHPPTYDAFGMSVVEAAAFGTPSVLHAPKESPTVAIGAAELLKPARGEALAVDLTASIQSIAAWMTITLRDSAHLRSVGIAAQKRALEWDEVGNAKAVATFAADVLTRKHS
jgi:glycosyltransferase involved in cell wall biosynthesis